MESFGQMLSNKAKYGLKAMLYLAEREGMGGQPVMAIAQDQSISKKFLDNILLELKNNGLLISKKGRGGGYMLARPASEIMVGRVIRILDGPIALIPCVGETAYQRCTDCGSESSCRINFIMRQVYEATANILDKTSFSDLNASKDAHALILDYVI